MPYIGTTSIQSYIVHLTATPLYKFLLQSLFAQIHTHTNNSLQFCFSDKSGHKLIKQSESVRHSVVSDSLLPYRVQPARLLCWWNSLGKNTGVDCHSLLQGIFPTQTLNLGLTHCRQTLYHLNHKGNPPVFFHKRNTMQLLMTKVALKTSTRNSRRAY